MVNALPRLAITAGEPAGIGPELIAELARSDIAADFIVIADPVVLQRAAAQRGFALVFEPYSPRRITQRAPGSVRLIPQSLGAPCTPGQLNRANAAYVIDTLRRAGEGCLQGEFEALVTAPVHKGIINDAGFPFTGHTEFFATLSKTDVVMMLATSKLRVALVTTHLPLSQVSAALTKEKLRRTLLILHAQLREKFALPTPRITVLGLNPHAGEGGHLGHEEIDTIIPVLNQLRGEGMALLGPLPADTAFVPEQLSHCDAILAMYHDQGLPALKALGFGATVNVTLGLPFIRTSVDHGTALNLAGSGRADASSILAAAKMALTLSQLKHAA